MYSNFFGLSCLPFEDRADTRFYCATSEREETLAAMEYESREGKGATLVLGEAGTGKTLLVRTLLLRFGSSDRVVVLTWPSGGGMSLVREACKAFGVSLPMAYSRARGLARLRKHLARSLARQRRPVLLVDQAEHLTVENLSQLTALMDLQHNGTPALSIILVGSPSLRTLLDKPEFAGIRQKFFDEHTIERFDPEMTRRYIKHRMQVAGAAGADVFEPEAMTLIHTASGGTPRLINHMCNAALVAAYGAGQKCVNARIAAEVTGIEPPMETPVTAPAADIAADIVIEAPPIDDHPTPIAEPVPTAQMPTSVGSSFYGVMPDRFTRPAADSTQPAIGDTEPQLARLDRALARADRMATTSEAVLLQATAVEKHLTVLTEGAGRLASSLTDDVKRAAESATDLDERIKGSISDAERRAGTIAEQSAQLPELCDEAASSVDRIAEACERAGCVETDLKSVAEQFADKADSVQERIALLMAGVKTSETAHTDLVTTLHAVKEATESAAEQARHQQELESTARIHADSIQTEIANLQRTLDDVRREAGRIVDESALEQTRRQQEVESTARAHVDSIQAEIAHLQAALDDVRREAGRIVAESADEQARRKQELESAAREQITRMQGARDELRHEVDRVVAETLRSQEQHAEAVLDRFSTGLQERIAQFDSLDVRIAGTQRSADALSECVESSAVSTAALARRVEDMDARARDLTQRSDTAEQTMDKSVERGEKMMLDVQEHCGRIEIAQRSVSASLVDVGAAVERAAAAGERAVRLEQVAVRLEGSDAQAMQLIERLDTTMAQGDHLRDAIQSVLVEAETRVGQMDSHHAAAKRLLHELSDANVAAHDAVECANTSLRQTREAVDVSTGTAERLIADVTGLTEKTQAAAAALARRQEQASGLIQRIESLTTPAAGLVEQLGALTEEAGTQATVITERSESARKLVDDLGSVNRTFIDARQIEASVKTGIEMARSVRDELAELTQTERQGLSQREAELEAMLQRVDESARPVKTFVQRLGEGMARVKQRTEEMAKQCDDADKKAERLTDLSHVLRTAEGIQAALNSTIEESRTVHGGLAEAAENAQATATTLGNLNATSIELAQKHAEAGESAEALITELLEQVTNTKNSTESADRLLNEFTDQAQLLARGIRELQARAAKVEQTVAEAADKPTKLIATAQAQAAQLERVCAAVRKVFGGLSKATLEARQLTADFGKASSTATGRFEQLNAETERAASTLHEWIEEAVRVQSRLETTIAKAPSIHETHPTEALTSMSRIVAPMSRIANPSAGGELEMLSEPPDALREIEEPVATTGKTRAQQVSALIEEAKMATTTD